MSNVTTAQDAARRVGRPLSLLVTLIKKDLALAREAAEEAAMPYYRAAGEKMLEAKPQMKHGEFRPWLKSHFAISDRQATRWMGLVEIENVQARTFSSINSAYKAAGLDYTPNKPRPQPWHEPVKEALGKVKPERYEERGNRIADERLLQRQLALQLIDIGFKALATKLHPDAGGSTEAMKRLNAVKAKLKACVSKY